MTRSTGAPRPDPKIVGGRIRRLRDRLGLTQPALALKLDISEASLSHYETGRYLLPVNVAMTLARLGKVRVEWMYSKSRNKEDGQ